MKRVLLILGVFVGTLALPTLSALAVGGLLQLTGLAASRSPLFWITAAPALYLLWLLTLALLYALHVRLMAGKLEKPRRLAARDGRRDAVQLILLGQMYRRAALLGSLPFLGIFAQTPLLRDLMFLTYAKRVQIGKQVVLYGKILDPRQCAQCHDQLDSVLPGDPRWASGFGHDTPVGPVHAGSHCCLQTLRNS